VAQQIQHAEGFALDVVDKRVVIVASEYDSNGVRIDINGAPGQSGRRDKQAARVSRLLMGLVIIRSVLVAAWEAHLVMIRVVTSSYTQIASLM
jgi:hypothetical protein